MLALYNISQYCVYFIGRTLCLSCIMETERRSREGVTTGTHVPVVRPYGVTIILFFELIIGTQLGCVCYLCEYVDGL